MLTVPSTLPIAVDDADLDDRIAAREAELAILKQQRADRQAAAFLFTVARVVPAGVVFSAAELLAHAALDRELAQAIGRRTAKQLGHYLKALAARPVAGFVLQQAGERTNRGCIWAIAITP